MSTFAISRYPLSVAAAFALLNGCGTLAIDAGGSNQYLAAPKHPDVGKSWMSRDAKLIRKLLYVSDWSTNDVFVYNYKTGKLVGKLTGFNSPYGQCVDKKGNVWITSYGAGSVTKFAHGGTKPIKALTTDYQPSGCSVDPTTGNLAVAGFLVIDVFPKGRGKKQVYRSAVCFPFWAPGYDNAGNLYAEALLYGSAKPLQGYSDPLACELPHGGTSLRGVHFTGFGIYYPGSVMWDGRHLTLTDREYQGKYETAIDRVTEDASGNLTLVEQTILNDDCDGNQTDVPQPFIVGKTVVGGNLRCTDYGSMPKFDYWAYPAGGNPKSSLQSPPTSPHGESVSIATTQ